jgi:hypothetical protein
VLKSLIPLLAAFTLSLPAAAASDGIWSCASVAANNPYTTDLTSYFAINSNGTTSVLSPINWNDAYNFGALTGIAIVSQLTPTHYSGFSTMQSIVTMDVDASGALNVVYNGQNGQATVKMSCSRVW